MFNAPIFEINLSNLVKNYNLIKSKVGKCGAVIKCNAYGFGMIETVSALLNASDCVDFFVSDMNEAIKVRNVHRDINIYVMSGFEAEYIDTLWEHDLIPVCFNEKQIELWNKKCKEHNTKKEIVIQIETGLNRLGLDLVSFQKIAKKQDCSNIKFVMHHLACGYEKDETVDTQLRIMEKIKDFEKSLSSSCGVLLDSRHNGDITRIGRFLYGSDEQSDGINLNIVGKLYAQIISMKSVRKGYFIGYSKGYRANKDMRIAIVNIGYGDGYSVKGGFVFTNGQYAQIISCSMDYLILNITDMSIVDKKVELLGENITFDKIAHWNHRVKGMEITCVLGNRIKRVYI
ncbi:alanine racemase [Candidatus Cytomitobacter primus]|uniref:alanine racemase n=1 Tax=Candidatus Cytomitobacter primus TaxID=2066024 RepID=A0A5C0UGJ2_9PROT|nr:alanine racemase [Candidatus Cytomitobacter primus]QEK38412.1 alanine racemase [Candidatus Cytomitobacter primus]